ncbi:hypothetical protein CAter282_0986 [Collimonas arenae]|uniref:Uncharacterized protein n=1 Tax=Collimonas arenae TaxID=279058 RepID=A0A127QGQ9_9BURK|nr:hypothetical protein CAter282_0986 [Collimonas arenae]
MADYRPASAGFSLQSAPRRVYLRQEAALPHLFTAIAYR